MQWVGSPAIQPPGVVKSNGAPYTVFTPFSKTWKSLPGLHDQIQFSAPIQTLPEQYLDWRSPNRTIRITHLFPPGEDGSATAFNDFTGRLNSVEVQWDALIYLTLPDGTAGSGWHFSALALFAFRYALCQTGITAVYKAIQTAPHPEAIKSAETWLNELIWREFYIHILYHFPRVREGELSLARCALGK